MTYRSRSALRRRSRRSRLAIPLIALAITTVYPVAAAAAKVDTVELENGNLVTGEIKELRQGKLKYSTDSMGTIYIEWDEITQLMGKARYRIETTDGALHFGSIDAGTEDGVLVS